MITEDTEIKPCPFCGTSPHDDLEDFFYPANRERTLWSVGCVNPSCHVYFECDSEESALIKWNTRANEC